MKYVLDIPSIVYRDIKSIRDYIAVDKPYAAKGVAEKLIDAIRRIPDNPLIYMELNKKFDVETDLRLCLVQPYIILFKVSESVVKVYRVLDGRSDYLVNLGLKDSKDDGK